MNSKCRFCNNELSVPIIDLGKTPLANSYLNKKQIKSSEKKFPLQVFVCKKCFLVQLKEYETSKNIFSEYAYLSSYSSTWLEHSRNYVNMIIKRLKITKKNFVVEIASNDGYLLQYFIKKNIPVLGIEASKNISKISVAKGIPTTNAIFGKKLAEKIIKKNEPADLIIANNVLAHVPNIHDFIEGIRILLKHDGVVTIEVPHLLTLIANNEFDTIYHEHFSYFSLTVLKKIFSFHDMKIFDIDELETHGGSIRIYVTHKNNKIFSIHSKIYALINKEKRNGLCNMKTYHNFNKKILKIKHELNEFLSYVNNSSKTIICYGAPAKGNTLLNYCAISSTDISCTVDRNPYKQNLHLPGSHIPITEPSKITKIKPDYLLILPWNLSEEIIQQTRFIRKWGGKFVIPIPSLQIIE